MAEERHTWSYSEDGKIWVHVACGAIHECKTSRDKPPSRCHNCGHLKNLERAQRTLGTENNLKYWYGNDAHLAYE